jgi:biopolymer transport protein ExbD
MGASLGTSSAFSEINMTPLIDIVLVVLIIMMVNIPIQIEEMGLKLPAPQLTPPPPQPPSEQLVIQIYPPVSENTPATVALNLKLMGEEEMLFEITRRLRPMSNKNVFVDADPRVEYGDVIDMIDLARQAGAANVGLAKLKPEGPRPATSVSAGAGIPRGVFIGSPLVSGAITEVTADGVIQPLKGRILACYEQRLPQAPGITGSYSIYVEVGPLGELLSPPRVQDDTVGDEALSTCVTQVVQALKYAPLKSGNPDVTTAAIRYPVLFSPG